MKELELAQSLLKEVIEDNTPFLNVLKNTFQTKVELRAMRNDVAGLLGCELRHHILLNYLIKDIEGLTPEQQRYLCLGLANNYYYKHLDPKAVEEDVIAYLGEEKKEQIQALFQKAENPEEIIPTSISRDSRLYLSLRYNAPEWAIKILQHYGNPLTFRCLRKFSRPLVSTLRLRVSKAGKNALEGNPDFAPSAIEDIYCYKGSQSLRKNELFRAGKLFSEKMLVKAIVDEYKVGENSEILLYNGNDDCSFEYELIETYQNKVGMYLAVPNADEKVAVKRFLKQENLLNAYLFSAPDPLSMDASISRPLDLVFAVPNSTNFDRIPETPDYLLHFDTDTMDALLEQEKNVLEGCAKYVAVGGKLVYMVFTLSKKEGKSTISGFLKAHPEFRLHKQEEYFPFAQLETAAYVAVLERVEETLVAPSPLTDLAPIQQAESYSASASSK